MVQPPFISTKMWQSCRKKVFNYALVWTKQVQAHQLKHLQAPAVTGVAVCLSDFKLCLYQGLQTRKKKLPPPQKSSPGNTNLHLIRFFSWNCHRSIQYTDWSCDNRQNFKTQLFDLSDQGCPKSLHQHHQRAGRVKGWGLKLSLVTTHTESHCSEGLGRHNAESLYTWK